MGQFTPSKVTLLSVYPLARQIEQKHLGITLYSLPEAEKDKIIVREPMVFGRPLVDDVVTPCEPGKGYCLLNVYDTFQYVRDLLSDEERAIPMPIDAPTVGQCLVDIWANPAMGVTFGPGIMLIAGDTPTERELKQVRDRQYNYFVALVQDADAKFRKGGTDALNINEIHRRACTALGVEREWNKAIRQDQVMKDCPACSRSILGPALVCEHCHVNLVRFYEEMEIEPDVNVDPVVAGHIQRRKQAKSSAVQDPAPVMPEIAAENKPKPAVQQFARK